VVRTSSSNFENGLSKVEIYLTITYQFQVTEKETTSQHWKEPPKFGNTSFVDLPMKVGLQPSW